MKKQNKKSSLTLHGLLGALSFWGTATRLFLFAILAVVVTIVALSETVTPSQFDNEIMITVYVLAIFAVLDVGYVMIARIYPLQKQFLDIASLVVGDVLLAALYIVPKVIVSQSVILRNDPLILAIFVPIIILSLRMLVGMLTSQRR